MKTRKEIEEYLEGLGIKIKPFIEKIALTGARMNFKQTLSMKEKENCRYYTFKIINKDAENALLDLISKSIINDDMETAITAIQVLQEESLFYKEHRDSAIRKDVPLEKKIAFDLYCNEHGIEYNYTGPISAYINSPQNKERKKEEKDKDDEER